MLIGYFDIETEIYKSFGWNIGNPHDLRNYIVCWSLTTDDAEFKYKDYYSRPLFEEELKRIASSFDLLVCHNAKFDILFMWIRYEWFREWVQNGGRIWCTMLAEHIITGQRQSYASLNECALKYGGTVKDDRPKEFWDRGYKTKDIPMEILLPYNTYDCINTGIVFREQLKVLKKQGQLALAKVHMEDLLFVIIAEANGIYMDKELGLQVLKEHQEKKEILENQVLDLIEEAIPEVKREHWNINSNQQMSVVFFGGMKTIEEVGEILDEDGTPKRFGKTSIRCGEVKTKKFKRSIEVKGLGHTPDPEWKNNNGYSTDEKVIRVLAQSGCKVANFMLKYTKEETIITKYLTKFLDSIYEKDNCIHARFSIDQDSGRMGAKNPPILTIPREL